MRELARRRPLAGSLIAGLALLLLWMATLKPSVCVHGTASALLWELYFEQGRQILLTGDAERALVYLSAAYHSAEDDTGLGFLVARAVDALPAESVPEGLRQPKGARSVKLGPGPHTAEAPEPWSNADLNGYWTRIVAVDVAGAEVWVFEFEDGRRLLRLDDAPAAVSLVGFSSDGSLVAGLHPDGRFSLWDSATGVLRMTSGAEVPASTRAEVSTAMAFSPDGHRLAVAGPDGFVRISETAGGAVVTAFESGAVAAAAYHPEGRRLVTAGSRGVMVWESENGAPVVSPDRPRGKNGQAAISCLGYSPDGRRILAAGNAPEVRYFHATTGELEGYLPGSRSRVRRAVFGPEGELILAIGDDGSARIWDVGRGRLLALFTLAPSAVIHAEYGPRRERFATLHADGTLEVRSVPLDERGAAEIERLRRCVAPWRLVSGRLLPARPDPRHCTEFVLFRPQVPEAEIAADPSKIRRPDLWVP